MSRKKFFPLFLIFFVGCSSPIVVPNSLAESNLEQTGITQTLLELLDKQDKTRITSDDYESTSLRQLITLGTPAGYRIKLRYLEFGMSLAEALKVARDPELKSRLIEMVQWSRKPRVRAEAILTLASLGDPAHRKYIKEAVLDGKVGIRFAAIEALQLWNQEDSIPLLKLARDRDWSPLVKILASQALLSLGDQSSIDTLWKGLGHDSWIIRAMSARYLGDYANPDDYEKIVSALSKETRNDFVIAELSIAALKLISKKGEKIWYSPASKGWRDNDEVAFTVGKGGVVTLEPLVIVPPRLKIPQSLKLAAQINTQLLRLIKERLDIQMSVDQAQDPVYQELNSLVTPSGFALQTRYSQLSYLVVEGLAGTQDPLIRSELQNMALSSSNPLIRASALIALAYNRDKRDIYLIQEAFHSKNAIVRFGAMEAIEAGRFEELLPSLSGLAGDDTSPALQVYAIQMLAKFGDSTARYQLLNHINDLDWPARSMAYWYLGRYGDPSDYSLVLSRMGSEDNPFVKAEIVLAALRLAPL